MIPSMPAAVNKIIQEGSCRLCCRRDIETAHLWPRARGASGYDDPDICIPLCKYHHVEYDSHELDILPYLTLDEQLALVREAGGIQRAINRACGEAIL